MLTNSMWSVFIPWLLIVSSCGSGEEPLEPGTNAIIMSGNENPPKPKIKSVVISRDELPEHFDTSRTYVYRIGYVNPESLLTVIWNSGILISQAWFPLDNLCMDPIGPRFTVELANSDMRLTEFGFAKGVGRLLCATRLKKFTISN